MYLINVHVTHKPTYSKKFPQFNKKPNNFRLKVY